MKVKYINYGIMRSKKMERYPGYLPALVQDAINSREWMEFLKKEGLLTRDLEDKIYANRHNTHQQDKEELIKWCEENPQYADFITWEED